MGNTREGQCSYWNLAIVCKWKNFKTDFFMMLPSFSRYESRPDHFFYGKRFSIDFFHFHPFFKFSIFIIVLRVIMAIIIKCCWLVQNAKFNCFNSMLKQFLIWNSNNTACIRAKPWMFRPPFKVYGAVIPWKKNNLNFFIIIWDFF